VQQGVNEEVVHEIARFEESPAFSAREKLAMRVADYMALNHQGIHDDFFAALRREFSPAEIIELGIVTGLFIGYGRLLAIMDLEEPVETPCESSRRFD
jgi:alkylhydroperoxidase family enzyme